MERDGAEAGTIMEFSPQSNNMPGASISVSRYSPARTQVKMFATPRVAEAATMMQKATKPTEFTMSTKSKDELDDKVLESYWEEQISKAKTNMQSLMQKPPSVAESVKS